MKLNSDAKRVVRPPRRFVMAFQDQVKAELEAMVGNDVIAPVIEPTEWVLTMVVVRKDSDAICIDPKDLNEAIQRENYPMRTVEEVVARIQMISISRCLMPLMAFGKSL